MTIQHPLTTVAHCGCGDSDPWVKNGVLKMGSGEETALPCVRRAVEILDEAVDEPLLQKLMACAISRENSADETVSEAMATVFARHPDAVSVGAASFVPARARILVRSIESGWSGVRKTLEPAIRDERDAQLKIMLTEWAKKAGTK